MEEKNELAQSNRQEAAPDASRKEPSSSAGPALPDKKWDWLAKIVCVVFAILIWLYVMQVDSPEFEKTLDSVPITITGTDRLENEYGLTVYSGYGNTMRMSVIGKKSLIAALDDGEITASVDVSSITKPGTHSLDVQVSLPDGITEQSKSVNQIPVYIDKKESRAYDVRVNSSFTIPTSYELGTAKPEYDYVTVTGPATVLDTISHAVIRIDLGQVERSIITTGQVELVTEDGAAVTNPYISYSNTTMTVTIPVYTTKEIPVTTKSVHGYLNAENASVTVSPSSLQLYGDPEVLNALHEISLPIDEKTLTSNEVSLNMPIELPEGVTIVDDHHAVHIVVKQVGTVTETLRVTDFRVRNPNGIRYEVKQASIAVTVRGTPEQIAQMTPEKIHAVVDLSPYGSDDKGLISVPLEMKILGGDIDSVYEIGTYTVSVQVNS